MQEVSLTWIMPLNKKNTKNNSKSAVFGLIGASVEINSTSLPTRIYILKYYSLTFTEKKVEMNGLDPLFKVVSQIVAEQWSLFRKGRLFNQYIVKGYKHLFWTNIETEKYK